MDAYAKRAKTVTATELVLFEKLICRDEAVDLLLNSVLEIYLNISLSELKKLKLISVTLVRGRTIPTKVPPLVGEVNVDF
jgi:hypothetical protein